MKTSLLFSLPAAAGALLFLGGCGGGAEDKPVLHVYNWSDYIADGLLEQFEEAYDCEVVYDTYDSNEALYAKLKAGASGYDVIFPSSYMVKVMEEEGMLQPIVRGNMPNLANIDPEFLASVAADPAMAYSVPYMSGTTGLAYRSDVVEDFSPSWRIYEREDLRSRMTLLNDMREVLGAALKTLGYSLNTTDAAEIEEAADLVISWKRNIARFDNDGYKAGIASREFWVVQGYGGDIQQIIDENEDENIVFVLPEEGFALWEDCMAIPADAPNVELAEQFINFMHSAEVAAANIEYNYYLCPNTAAYALLDEEILSNEVVFIPAAKLARGEQIRDVGEDLALYVQAWNRVKGSD
ncbi:MAG: spermidine/putrescine ABC transporter substrate-binding protein [Opitutales bacterium]